MVRCPVAEGARLESVYTATYRGFESPSPPYFKKARTKVRAFFACGTYQRMKTPTGVRQLATPVGQTASLRAGCPDKNARAFEPTLHCCESRRGCRLVMAASEAVSIPTPPCFLKSSVQLRLACGTADIRGRQQCLSWANRPYLPEPG